MYLTLYLQDVLDHSPLEAGPALLPDALGCALVAGCGRRAPDDVVPVQAC